MKLTLFNGSPRGKRGNTTLLLEHFSRGFCSQPDNTTDVAYLKQTGNTAQHVEMFQAAERVILAFPLYTDAMPGIVKIFIEALKPLCGKTDNPDFGFLVHSGFPEALHSRAVEHYLEKLAARLGCRYAGTIVKGGSEGMKMMPERRQRKTFDLFFQLGQHYAEHAQFDQELLQNVAKPERLPALLLPLLKVVQHFGLFNRFWNQELKANQVYDQRFARPYIE